MLNCEACCSSLVIIKLEGFLVTVKKCESRLFSGIKTSGKKYGESEMDNKSKHNQTASLCLIFSSTTFYYFFHC
jgi:hypothetical protein